MQAALTQQGRTFGIAFSLHLHTGARPLKTSDSITHAGRNQPRKLL